MRRLIPRWRKMTWVLVLWVGLIVVWMIAGASAEDTYCDDPANRGSLSKEACEAARDVGEGIGVALIFFLGFIGFIILGLVWLMSRPKHRTCPQCGHDVKKGRTTCKNCGYDFAAALRPPEAESPPGAAT